MKNRWLMGAAAAALTVAGAVSAQAADLPTKKAPPAPVFVPPPFTWTGFYVGLNAGGVWGSANTTWSPFLPAAWLPYAAYFPSTLNASASGFIGGGQAGYNWQTGAFVLGVETDFDGTSLSKNVSWVGGTFLLPTGPTDYLTANAHASLDWLGTTRGRIGFVATPDNRLMFYGTGGVAYGGGSIRANVFDFDRLLSWSGSESPSRVGWTIGAGVEYALTNNITIRGEYLYYDLGSVHTNIIPVSGYPFVPTSSYIAAKTTIDGNIVRAGINYKF